MKLLVIILCLISERYLLHSISYRRFQWFPDYAKKILKLTDDYPFLKTSSAQLAVVVLPIVLLVSLIYFLSCTVLYGFVGFLLSLAILYYCFGVHNIFYPLSSSNDAVVQDQVSAYFADINPQMFSLVFWFLIGGPIAALVYRLITLCQNIPELAVLATELTDILEWAPARIMMLVFLFVGNFQKGFPFFLEHLLAKPSENTKIIGECAMLALISTEGEDVSLATAERFMEYALIVFLVFIAIFTLIAWVY